MGRDGGGGNPVHSGEQTPVSGGGLAGESPRDGLEGESPREACANLAMEFRVAAASPVTMAHFAAWASRLERAVQRMDAEKIAPQHLEWLKSHLLGADFRWGEPETSVIVFGPVPPHSAIYASLKDTMDSIVAWESVGSAPSGAP